MSTPLPTPSKGYPARPGSSDASPPTSLAVTVFIVAFAVIFALFGGFLVVGLVRRRRNPERYGPRPAAPGRAKQTRKKGLAMAVLESIPVIKFGANDRTPDGGAMKDVELRGGLPVDEPTTAGATRNSIEITAVSPRPDMVQLPPSGQSTPIEVTPGRGCECSICIADFVESEEVRVLPCNHRFHPACIDPWLLNVSGTCPICRYDLQPNAPPGETNAESSPVVTLAIPPASTVPRDRTSFRSRLREIRQSGHTGPEYISALRHLYNDHEHRRQPTASSPHPDVAPQETRPA